MFVLHYKRRNLTFTSEELYHIFKSYGYKINYKDFCRQIIKILNKSDFKEINDDRGDYNNKYYEVTYKGYQKIMLCIDD